MTSKNVLQRMKKILFGITVLLSGILFAQKTQEKDSVVHLSEVIIKGLKENLPEQKISHSVEDYLQSSQNVNLIRRGAYAFEPVLNNMFSERSVVTIDGMRIFGACTDKMDPVTSYMEMHNLSDISISSGQEGSHYGTTIGGNIDLKSQKVHFSVKPQWKNTLQTSVKSNNLERFTMGNTLFSSGNFGANISFSHRKADNYRDGNRKLIKYSQYEKSNASANVGFKIGNRDVIRGSVIYDSAKNIGYPALPMDVSKARALISMLTHTHYFENQNFELWETKLYYNDIYHEMDDSFREEGDKLPVKMDMPGKSETFGGISKIRWKKNRFSQDIRLNAFHNLSTAEMTMHYRTGGTMFTYTWPKVSTKNVNFSMENQWEITENQKITLNGNLGWQNNYVKSDVGYNLNQVFHRFERSKNRVLPSLYGSYLWQGQNWEISAGAGWGQRAPSVSESYGFYLFNSSDGYDYIGNPNLDNETSWEGNFSAQYAKNQWKVAFKSSFFHIQNYIFGQPFGEPAWQMTPLGAEKRGLKMYESLPHANQLNVSMQTEYNFGKYWLWKNTLGYAYGADFKVNPLPFVRPPYYLSSVAFRKNRFSSEVTVEGDLKQTRFSTAYGEDATPAYTLTNLSVSYVLPFGSHQIDFQLEVENLLDTYYTTYADWKNFPRMGRNIILGVKYQF
ncbi:hypothetical protein CAPN001_01100 [Capnocytophaga stomatis]|nr:hypothetical protein CAPN001_01100 [Capnocytophaga stomatis]